MREKTCCFTGHRHIPPKEVDGIRERLEAVIKMLYKRGVVYYGAGGALGFDTLAAEAVLRLRDNGFPNLRLILVLPCLDQTKGWNAVDEQVLVPDPGRGQLLLPRRKTGKKRMEEKTNNPRGIMLEPTHK